MTHENFMIPNLKTLCGIRVIGQFCIQCYLIWSMINGMWLRSFISSNNENQRLGREFNILPVLGVGLAATRALIRGLMAASQSTASGKREKA